MNCITGPAATTCQSTTGEIRGAAPSTAPGKGGGAQRPAPAATTSLTDPALALATVADVKEPTRPATVATSTSAPALRAWAQGGCAPLPLDVDGN